VIGLADGRFPHASAFPGEQWEEERRLLYVAATRARKHLYLSYPRELMSPDRRFQRVGMSPFLSELAPGVYDLLKAETVSAGGFGFRAGRGGQKSPGAGSKRSARRKKLALEDFVKGSRVNHPFFGVGTVHKTTPPRSLDVAFDRHGMKTLHLDYAKLTILT
jgi:DNA helicase-2/ATP-dependent DNA helicase PcrA